MNTTPCPSVDSIPENPCRAGTFGEIPFNTSMGSRPKRGAVGHVAPLMQFEIVIAVERQAVVEKVRCVLEGVRPLPAETVENAVLEWRVLKDLKLDLNASASKLADSILQGGLNPPRVL